MDASSYETIDPDGGDCTVYDLFQKQVRLHGNEIACSQQHESLTYQALDNASLRITMALHEHGIRAGDIVPVLGSRCPEMMASLLAVSRIRACYVPVDLESWSKDRIDTILNMVDAKCILLAGNLLYTLNQPWQFIRIDRGFLNSNGHNLTNMSTALPPPERDLAYIIFTSGTTGKPKGVMVSNHSLVNYVRSGSGDGPFNLGVGLGDKVLLLFSIAFDACTGVIFSTLCNGGHLVLSSPPSFIEDARFCSILPVSPSLLSTLQQPELYQNVRGIFLGGESPSASLIRKWWAPHRNIFNAYGPTEATIACSMARLAPDTPVTIGKAMFGTSMLILDGNMKTCTEGEIFISGPGLAVGYYQNEGLSREKFIQFDRARFYRTGDIGRQTLHGITFLGRSDSMAKNRGFLINIDLDVVAALLSFPEVQSAVAFMHKGRLVAVVTPKECDTLDLRRKLAERYDHFQVPDIIKGLPRLPSNANGKMDVDRLKYQFDEDTSAVEDLNDRSQDSKLDILKGALAISLALNERDITGTESFWSLGGNSLSAITLISHLQERGFVISLAQLFSLPSVSAISAKLTPIMRSRPPAEGGNGHIPITPVQMGMIRSSIRKPLTNYMLIALRIGKGFGNANSAELQSYWNTLLQRHSIFRTSFDINTNSQVVGTNTSYRWKNVTTSSVDREKANREETAALYALTVQHLDGGVFVPINAFCHIRQQGGSKPGSTLLWLVHHSQIDGWSMSILLRELHLLMSGQPLPDTPSYLHYARKATKEIQNENASNVSNTFWRRILDGFHDGSPLDVPHMHDSTGEAFFSQESLVLDLSIRELEVGARCLSVSTAVIFHAAWALLLSVYAATDRVVFGTVFSGRTFALPSVANIVGPLINFVPFPFHVEPKGSKADLLRRVRDLMLEIGEHQSSAVSAMDLILSGSSAALFSTSLFLEYDLPPIPTLPLTMTRTDFPEFGITAYVKRTDSQVHLQIVSDTSQYNTRTVATMLHHFRNLVLALLDPRTVLVEDTLRLMMETKVTLSLTQTSRSLFEPYSGCSSLKAALETAADRWPGLVCIESTTCTLTYSSLDNLANLLALQLKVLVEPGQSVPVIADGSVPWLIAVVAIMKLAAVYVPLDTKLPPERMGVILRAVNAKICLILSPESMALCLLDEVHKVPVYEYLQKPLKERIPNLARNIQPKDYAYVIFTSGSTGTPKGVRVTHEAVLSYLTYPPARMHAAPGRRHAQMFSPGFDVNIAEIFGTLCYGATLVLKDPDDPYRHLSKVHATMITPSFLSVCHPEAFTNLDTILFAGEAVPQTLSDRWSGNRRLYNSYGPCECTIGALFKLLIPGEPVTLGWPIPRVGVYLLDRHNRPVPEGVIGEICLSGVQVMEGYLGLGMVQLNTQKFSTDPFVVGQRMYKTGDLATWTPSREIVFLGRRDNQIKVRGFRVELDEVENAILAADTTINRAAAVLSGDNIDAFVSPESVDLSRLRASLQSKLPSYACPSRIILMSSLPLTSNQKLDRKALSKYTTEMRADDSRIGSDTEQLIANVWRETANIEPEVHINSSDDYMTIGGNSLRQIRVAQKLSNHFGITVPLVMVLRNTVLCELATALEEHLSKLGPSETPATLVDSPSHPVSTTRSLLSDVEEELYLLHSLSTTPSTFNVACTLEFRGDAKTDCIEQALRAVVSKHEMLNICYESMEGFVTRTKCSQPFDILRKSTNEQDSFDLQDWVDTPFELHSDRLIRVAVIEHPGKMVLSVVQHHIITDYTSLGLFWEDLILAHRQLLSGHHNGNLDRFGENAYASYSDWAQRKREAMTSPPPLEDLRYWDDQFAEGPQPPFSHGIESLGLDDGSFCSFFVDQSSTTVSLAWCLAAIAFAICSAKGIKDLVICIPYDRRDDPGTGEMLGCFLDRLPIRLRLSEDIIGEPTLLCSYAESQLKGALSHAIPYQDILAQVGRSSAFDIMLTYHRQEHAIASRVSLPDIVVKEVSLRPSGAKFPILFEFTQTSAGLRCDIEYKTRLVESSLIPRITSAVRDMLVSPLSSQASSMPTTPSTMHQTTQSSRRDENSAADNRKTHAVREAFAIALGTDVKLVENDQTYKELGGTSILSMRIQWLLKRNGFGVDLKDIIMGQTPRNIAGRLQASGN